MNAIELFGSIYEKGAVIFEQDAPGDCMYVIQSGAVEISCRRGGAKVVLNLLAKGDFFGELALIDRRPRSAGATAITRARLLPIGREFFFNRSQTDLSVIFQVMRTLCHRIENTDRVLRALVSRDDSVREAMAATLDSASAAAPDEGGSIARQADACLAYAEAEAVRPAVPPVFFRDTELPVVRFARGETIFNEGDAGEEMFVVVDGAVDIFTEAAGQRILLSRIGPAEFFGEMALVTGHPRTATAVAVADARLISIDNARLSERISRQPELALFIIQVLIVRLRASTVAIESPARSLETLRALLPPVIKKQTRARLAVISLSSCGGCAAMLIQNRNELATLAGLVDVVYCPMLMDAEDFGRGGHRPGGRCRAGGRRGGPAAESPAQQPPFDCLGHLRGVRRHSGHGQPLRAGGALRGKLRPGGRPLCLLPFRWPTAPGHPLRAGGHGPAAKGP